MRGKGGGVKAKALALPASAPMAASAVKR